MPNHVEAIATSGRVSGREKRVAVDYDRCTCCGACVPVCPSDSVTLYNTTLRIEHATCTGCRRCIVICPTRALTALAWNHHDEDAAGV